MSKTKEGCVLVVGEMADGKKMCIVDADVLERMEGLAGREEVCGKILALAERLQALSVFGDEKAVEDLGQQDPPSPPAPRPATRKPKRKARKKATTKARVKGCPENRVSSGRNAPVQLHVIAQQVILTAGKPLRPAEVYEGMQAAGAVFKSADPLKAVGVMLSVGSGSRLAAPHFRRVKPGLYWVAGKPLPETEPMSREDRLEQLKERGKRLGLTGKSR